MFDDWEAAQPKEDKVAVADSDNTVNDLAGFSPAEVHTQCKA